MAIQVKKYEKKYEYIPVSERKSDKPTTFIFRRLSHEEIAKFEDNLITIYQDQSLTIKNATYLLNMIKVGLVDVKNLLDESGKEVKLEKDGDVVSSDFIELLPTDLIMELGSVIANVSKYPDLADVYLGNFEEKSKETSTEKNE